MMDNAQVLAKLAAVEALLAEIRGSLGPQAGGRLELCRVGYEIVPREESQVQPPCDLSSQANLANSCTLGSWVIDKYLDLRRHEVSPQHLKGIEFILRRFRAAGHPLSRDGVRGYRDELLREGREVTTVNQHLVLLTAFARWAGVVDGLDGLRLKAAKGKRAATQRAAFTDAEVVRLLRATAWKGRTPSQRWLPRLMAYTGARPEELAQLRGQDVRLEGDVLVLDLATLDDGQRRKNEASRRLVPVHSALEPGLLRLLGDQTPGPLFPELGDGGRNGRRAEAPSRWFNRKVLRDFCNIKDPRKVLYSFRHTVATKLKHLGVEESLIAELLGHTNSSMTTGRYGKAYPVEQLKEAVEQLKYEA